MNRLAQGTVLFVLYMWVGAVVSVAAQEQGTVLSVSSIEHVDVEKQLVTFKTTEGRAWTLRVADPSTMTREPIVRGDIVLIEVNNHNQIVKILKVAEAVHPSSGTSGIE